MEEIIVKVDGKEYNVLVEDTEEGKILVHCGSDVYEVETKSDVGHIFSDKKAKGTAHEGKTEITSPLPGIITEVKVKKGDIVEKGTVLVKLIAMKMENEVVAAKSGTISEVTVKKDDKVNRGDILIIIE